MCIPFFWRSYTDNAFIHVVYLFSVFLVFPPVFFFSPGSTCPLRGSLNPHPPSRTLRSPPPHLFGPLIPTSWALTFSGSHRPYDFPVFANPFGAAAAPPRAAPGPSEGLFRRTLCYFPLFRVFVSGAGAFFFFVRIMQLHNPPRESPPKRDDPCKPP